MLYRIYAQADTARFYTEVHTCSKIPYYTSKEMDKRYPDGCFVIIGEIGGLARTLPDGDQLCVAEGKIIPILPRGSFKRPFEWVIGYIQVQENSYVAVIGGCFHPLMSVRYFLKRSLGL